MSTRAAASSQRSTRSAAGSAAAPQAETGAPETAPLEDAASGNDTQPATQPSNAEARLDTLARAIDSMQVVLNTLMSGLTVRQSFANRSCGYTRRD
jgi:hypothetical protein